MADNTTISAGSGGDVVRDIDRGTAKTQVMQIDAGGQSAESLVSAANPLPVLDTALANISADNPVATFLTGDPNGDFAGVNILEKLVDDTGDLKMQVNLAGGLLVDANKAIKFSDGIVYTLTAPANAPFVVDTTGYASIELSSASASTLSFSGDGIFFTGVPVGANSSGIIATGGTGNTQQVFPAYSRYFRVIPGGAGVFTIVLRCMPAPVTHANIIGVGGTAAVSTGVAGMLSVGGNIAPGSARTANPVPVAGTDGTNLTRTLLTDTGGRLVLSATTPINTITPIDVLSTSYANISPLAVQELSRFEGSDLTELLASIRDELRVLTRIEQANNVNLAGIIRMLTSNGVVPVAQPELANDPDEYRLDPSSLTSVN